MAVMSEENVQQEKIDLAACGRLSAARPLDYRHRMPPTRDHTSQHFSVQHLIFRNENLHGIPPFGKTIGNFLG